MNITTRWLTSPVRAERQSLVLCYLDTKLCSSAAIGQVTLIIVAFIFNQCHTQFVDWCYCGREVLFEKVCLVVVYKLVLHGKQFLAKQIRGIE